MRSREMSPVEKVLNRLDNVKEGSSGWSAGCPAHDDNVNSLSVSEGNDGRVLLYCHAGCTVAQIAASLRISMRDLFVQKKRGKVKKNRKNRKELSPGLTLEQYSNAKQLPIKFLKKLRLVETYRRRPVVCIPYFGENGEIISTQFRMSMDGEPRFKWTAGSKLVPYGLWLLDAARQAGQVTLVEGASDAQTLWLHKIPALGLPGANSWKEEEWASYLDGIDKIYLVVEPDRGGDAMLKKFAGSSIRDRVRLVRLTAAKDASALYLKSPKLFRKRWAEAIASARPLSEIEINSERNELGSGSQATDIVNLARDVEFFHTAENEAFGSIQVEKHVETWRLRDSRFKRWLAARYFEQFSKAPSSQAIQDALGVLEGIALYKGKQRKVFTRFARRKKAIYVDLGDKQWRAVKIAKNGWKVVRTALVKFRRTRGLKALPVPVRNGTVNELRDFLNLQTGRDFILVISWLLAGLNPRGPYPVLILLGEAGSAKSTTARVLRELLDPNIAPLRSNPREVRDLMIAAQNTWVIAFDNVSYIHPWLSDALCQLATGGGFATRQLYADDEEKLFDAMRPIMLNGIDGFVTRGDLADRSLIIYLPAITDEKRRPEKEFWRDFRKAQPRILGALMDGIVCAIRRSPELELDRYPRMADFARWATAAEPALGWKEGAFRAAYDANRSSANTLSLEASPVFAPLSSLMLKRTVWRGTPTDLLLKLNEQNTTDDKTEQRSWPKNGQVLSSQLRRIAPNLRATGIDVQLGEKTAGPGSKRLITIRRKKRKRQAAD
jgi:hypothetical protein